MFSATVLAVVVVAAFAFWSERGLIERNIDNYQVRMSVTAGRLRPGKLKSVGVAGEARKHRASTTAKTFLTSGAEDFRSSHNGSSCGAGVDPLHQPQEAI